MRHRRNRWEAKETDGRWKKQMEVRADQKPFGAPPDVAIVPVVR